MRKVFITGANGLLGQKLVEIFSFDNRILASDLQPEFFPSQPEVSEEYFEYEKIDILDKEKLETFISSFKPEVIINSGAYTDVDGCEVEKDKAWKVNVEGVKNLAFLCKEFKIKLVHLSTDYIFDGKNGPYSEEEPPNPLGYYGLTKLESEKVIKENLDNYVIVRTNVLYGNGIKVNNFVLWVINRLKKGQDIDAVIDEFNNPTLADNLAQAISELVEKDFVGIINIAGLEYLSRFDFAKKIAFKFNLDQKRISPITAKELEEKLKQKLDKQRAKRPPKGGLKIDKAKKILATKLLDVDEGLEYMKKQGI